MTAPVRSLIRSAMRSASSCKLSFNGRKRGTSPARVMHDQFDNQPNGVINTSCCGFNPKTSSNNDSPIVADGKQETVRSVIHLLEFAFGAPAL